MDKSQIQYIRAYERGWDYCFEGIKNMGYHIIIPYRDTNLCMRLLRELWFRCRLPFRSIWYNPAVKKIKAQYIIVKDPLITKDFLLYLRKLYPGKMIILEYDNRVSNSINPRSIPSGTVELWSYDPEDCKKYGMNQKRVFYMDIYKCTGYISKKYDVLYLGRDKGRSKELLRYKSIFEAMGLHTYFHICADRSLFAKKKSFYKPKITYIQYLELQKQSKAILNIMPKGQHSITPRDMEAAFNNVKEITNNKGVRELEFYSPKRYFILGEDKQERLKDFLSKPLQPVPEDILEKYSFDKMVEGMISRQMKTKHD